MSWYIVFNRIGSTTIPRNLPLAFPHRAALTCSHIKGKSAFSLTFITNYWPEVLNEKPERYSGDTGGPGVGHRCDLLFLQVCDRATDCRPHIRMVRTRAGSNRLCLWSDILPGPR